MKLSDPGAPADPIEADRRWLSEVYRADRVPQLTVRAVVTGGLIGMLMAIASTYVLIRVGIGFTVTIIACILSYVAWAGARAATGGRLTQLSILENASMQATASAAGSATGSAVAVTFGALMLLDPNHAHQPWWIVALFTLTTAFMGVFLAIPLKRPLINLEQLPFPSGTASAQVLKGLYDEGVKSAYLGVALVSSMLCAVVAGVLSTAEDQFAALGRFFAWMKEHLFNVHIPGQIPEKGFSLMSDKPILGYGFEPGLMLLGLGMIVGLRVALSMFAASAVLYLVITPWLHGLDVQAAGQAGYVASIPLAGGGKFFHPLRWSLWGGASLLLFSSFTSLALQWRLLGRAATTLRKGPGATDHDAPRSQIEVPLSWMFIGMVPITIAMMYLQVIVFGLAWWLGIIAIAMCFLLSIVSARSAAETDFAPVGALGKVMQLLFAVVSPATGAAAMSQNVVGAGVAANSAFGASDLLGDLKTGYLVGANPRKQFMAQAIGVLFGVVAVVPAWFLLVPDYSAFDKYPFPAAQIWAAVAKAMTSGLSQLPESARYAIFIGALTGLLLPILERIFPRAKPYMPSATGLGLGWVVLFSSTASIAVGAVLAFLWRRASPRSEDTYRVAVASGMIAGESLVKALLAMAAVAVGLSA